MTDICKFQRFFTLILIVTSLGIVLVNITSAGKSNPSQQEPRNVYGIVYYNGTLVGTGANVTLTNLRTNENLTTITNENSSYVFDLQSLPSPYQDGDPLRIEARFNELIGQAFENIDLAQPGLQIDVNLEKVTLASYRIWGYTYFENYTLIEKSVTITITNQRTKEEINIQSSIIGKFECDISTMSLGYKNLDTLKLDSVFRDEWYSSAKVTVNLGNTNLESKKDLFYTQKGEVTTSSSSTSSSTLSMSSTSSSKGKSSSLDILSLGIALSVLPLLKIHRAYKEKKR